MLTSPSCSVAILLFSHLWGCTSTTNDKPSSSTSPPKIDGRILTKLLIDNLGTAGTFSDDFALAQKSNNVNMRLPAQQLEYMFWKSRDIWSKSAKQSIIGISEKTHKPPLFLIKYLLSVRLLANTQQIVESDNQCVSSVVSEATMIFTDEQFPKSFNHRDSAPSIFIEAWGTCTLLHTHSDCSGIALSTTLASLLMHVSPHKGAKNFVQDILQLLIDSQRQFNSCQLDTQREAHKSHVAGLMNILKKVLDPPPVGKCLQQHIQTILTQYIDFDIESQRTLEHCTMTGY